MAVHRNLLRSYDPESDGEQRFFGYLLPEPRFHLVQQIVLLDFNLFGRSVIGAPCLIMLLFQWVQFLLERKLVQQISSSDWEICLFFFIALPLPIRECSLEYRRHPGRPSRNRRLRGCRRHRQQPWPSDRSRAGRP